MVLLGAACSQLALKLTLRCPFLPSGSEGPAQVGFRGDLWKLLGSWSIYGHSTALTGGIGEM